MHLKNVYLLLAGLGTVLPTWQVFMFLRSAGFDVPEFFRQSVANHVAAALSLDVTIASVALWVLVLTDGRMAGVRKLWAPLAANIVFGLAAGLPLYLYMREAQLEETLRAH